MQIRWSLTRRFWDPRYPYGAVLLNDRWAQIIRADNGYWIVRARYDHEGD